jgi:MoaA/NifB/PqqE/SkfB family radical SAM enzyme
MNITGLHFLLTYQCTYECDHCFVWGSPKQSGVMTLEDIRQFLEQARDTGSVTWVYFEGGEPFLYYSTLLKGVQIAAEMGFQVGIVSNAYWATSLDDALECLRPFAGLLGDLSVSGDLYHSDEKLSHLVKNALAAAGQLGIPIGVISVAQPEAIAQCASGQLPAGESGVMYRGRAAEALAQYAERLPWETFDACPHEDLRDPGRVHLDPLGNIHICQGISLGNLRQRPLAEICASYEPESHPICGSLLAGGPAALVNRYELPHLESYADACHLCYTARLALRDSLPGILAPDQMYSVTSD